MLADQGGSDVTVRDTETGEEIAVLRGATIEDVERAHSRYAELAPELSAYQLHGLSGVLLREPITAKLIESWFASHDLVVVAREKPGDPQHFDIYPLRIGS